MGGSLGDTVYHIYLFDHIPERAMERMLSVCFKCFSKLLMANLLGCSSRGNICWLNVKAERLLTLWFPSAKSRLLETNVVKYVYQNMY